MILNLLTLVVRNCSTVEIEILMVGVSLYTLCGFRAQPDKGKSKLRVDIRHLTKCVAFPKEIFHQRRGDFPSGGWEGGLGNKRLSR